MTFFARSRATLALLLSIAGCGTPMGPATDAGPPDTGAPTDAGPLVPHWSNGPDFPTPIAFGSAMVIPESDGITAHLYVIGGGSGSFGTIGPFHSEIRRALINPDGSLGDWEDAGHINNGTVDVPLAGHGAIRIVGEDGSIGFAIAGGGSMSGYLPVVLAGYVQAIDGSIGTWGGFMPVISAAQGGEVFGSFNTFESHQLALVGGLQGTTPTDHVLIAAIMAGSSVPTWRDGPSLPAARYGHGSVQIGTGTPDIFLIGGMGPSGMLASDILTGTRDSALEITGWETAGTLTSAVVFPQTALIGTHVYVMGGVQGDPTLDPLATRVRVATATPSTPGVHGTIGAFAPVPGADLPEGRAAGLVATLGTTVYIVGGMMGPDHAASASVIYAQLER